MSNTQGNCQQVRMVLTIIIMAFVIQIFMTMISVAVAAGAAFNISYAMAQMFCWPVYCLSFIFSILLSVLCCLKKCPSKCE